MLGHGSNLKTNFGWHLDDDGNPEVFYWQGVVEHHEPFYYWCGDSGDGNYCDGPWCQAWRYTRQYQKENKLYKLTFDHVNRKVSRTLIWDGNANGAYSGNSPNWPNSQNARYGNLTFISKDVFLITEEWMPENPNEQSNSYDTYPRVILHANKIEGPNASGEYTVTPKIWSRLILKEGAEDSGQNNPNAARNDYPGRVIGLSFIPPESPDYDESNAMANIIVMTCDFPNGGLWAAATQTNSNQDVRRMILRLSTDNAEISIPDYYADTEGWTGPSSEGGANGGNVGVSSWKTIKDFGANDDPGYGANEGWCTLDSKGNLLYGDIMGYKSSNQTSSSRGHLSPNEGGPGYVFTLPNTNPAGDLGDDWKLYIHDVGCISAPLGLAEDIDKDTNSGNHVACYFDNPDSPTDYDFQNGLPANGFGFPGGDHPHVSGIQLGSGEIIPSNFNWNSEYSEIDGGMFHYNINSVLHANGGCCDIYGETTWGQNLKAHDLPNKDVILAFNARNNKRWMFAGAQNWSTNTAYNREGITVFRREEGTNKLVLLDSDRFGSISDPGVKDINGYRCVNYKFDNTWGAIYKVPCCLKNGQCDDLSGGICTNDPTFCASQQWCASTCQPPLASVYPTYVIGQYNWDSWKTTDESFVNSRASNVSASSGTDGEIPTIAAPGRAWTFQPFYYPETGGLSFRPKWKL